MVTDCIKVCQLSLDVLHAPEKRKRGKKRKWKTTAAAWQLCASFFFFLAACVLLTLGFLYSVLTVSFTESVRHRHGVMKRVLH